jgi:ABC-type Fe3+-hydroxamate transport system, periplasmic component
MKIKLLFISIILISSCTSVQKKQDKAVNTSRSQSKIHYAVGFSIKQFANYTLIEVRNPWDTARIMEKYILIDRNKETPANLPEGTLVKVPVQRVATCSSIFAGEYFKLGTINKIVAVSEPEYVDIPIIKDGLKNGQIADLGRTTTLNTEKLLAAKTDILVISFFEESMHDRLKKNGIIVVKDASYMEESPLGRTEWIKFEAAFLGKDSLANEIFSKIEKRYQELMKKAAATKSRPTVFTEKKNGDSWFIPGGNSYMGNFMKDAGANYLWSDLKHTGSVPLQFETVFSKAVNAEFWLIKYNNTQFDLTYKQLEKEYDLYKNFAAFKNKHIYAANSGTTPFYEEGPLEPDVVLSDLIHIFHPEVLLNYQPKYYQHIK